MTAELLNPPATSTPSAPAVTPSFAAVFLAPWLAIFHPTAAARTLVAASRGAFWATFLFLCLLHAFSYTFVLLSVEMPESNVTVRALLHAWRNLNRGSALGPVEAVFGVGLVIVPLFVCLASLTFVTRTLRSESFAAAFKRGVRAQLATVGFSLLVTSAFVLFLVHSGGRARGHWLFNFVRMYVDPEFIVLLAALVSAAWIIRRIQIAARAIENDGLAPTLPPRCEGCGYDLSHPSSDGRCTECGEFVERSLTPGIRRPGCEWENDVQHQAGGWLRTSLAVLLSPRRFYESLAMQADLAAASRFATIHLRYIGFGASLWMAGLWTAERFAETRGISEVYTFVIQSLLVVSAVFALAWGTSCGRFSRWRVASLAYFLLPLGLTLLLSRYTTLIGPRRVNEMYMLALVALFVAPLACWLGYRLGGAIVSNIAIYFRFLPDYRWAEKVILFESAFLWNYCVAWGILATSFILYGTWMTNSPLFSWLWRAFGMPPEILAVHAVTIALSILWARRYLIAFRAVRWSNF